MIGGVAVCAYSGIVRRRESFMFSSWAGLRQQEASVTEIQTDVEHSGLRC